jgi:hypothetical protein
VAKLKDKIENALNETRILVLGLQILIGFAFRAFFEPGFNRMSAGLQQVEFAALLMMLVGLGLMLIPVAFHRIALAGRDTAGLNRLATAACSAALLPFALSMALSFYLAFRWVGSERFAALAASVIFGVILFFWYGIEIAGRRRKFGELHLHAILDPLRGIDVNEEEQIDLSTRVKQVLIECRVVLPGAQALLGFQLIIMWMTDFDRMPQPWKLLHLASLTSIAVCTILLITPAAYHRIVEQGDDSENLVRFTSQMLLSAMVFLALGICGDFWIVARRIGLDSPVSTIVSAALLLLFLGSWFGYSTWKARHSGEHRATSEFQPHRAA